MRCNKLSLYLSIVLLLASYFCKAQPVITNPARFDGFGAQFQTIIYSAICAELVGAKFVYTPFKNMEHNYDNDPEFIAKKEWLINFMGDFEINNGTAQRLDAMNVIQFFEQNLAQCANSSALQKIKMIFKANKNRNHYFDNEHLHIVIHMRRPNPHDNRIEGANTPDEIFLNIINRLRVLYSSQNPLFHLHSQGNKANFQVFNAPDIVLHLNESVEDSFIPMVLADVLVTSRSSYSYTAAILSDGTVYYMPFWHPPLPHWIPIDTLR